MLGSNWKLSSHNFSYPVIHLQPVFIRLLFSAIRPVQSYIGQLYKYICSLIHLAAQSINSVPNIHFNAT